MDRLGGYSWSNRCNDFGVIKMTRKLPPLPWRIHADKRTSAAYLVYDKNNDFLSDYTSDEVAAYLEKAVNEYASDKALIGELIAALQACLDQIDVDTDLLYEGNPHEITFAEKNAQALLAKAKGE